MTILLLLTWACHSPKPAVDSAPTGDDTAQDTAITDDTGTPDDTGSPADDTGTVDDTGRVDVDGDGVFAAEDCDDTDPTVYPGAPEVCGDGVVNDCDGAPDAALDACTHPDRDDALAAFEINLSVHDDVRSVGVGDVNGDGLDDVALGWPGDGEWVAGAGDDYFTGDVFLYLGPISGTFTRGDEGADQVFAGNGEGDTLGWDIVPMGDVDEDGYDDFVVGAVDGWTGPPSGTDSVYLIHGPAEINSVRDAFTLVGPEPSAECLGSVLQPVPDQDGDGVTDLLVSQQCGGQAHLISGGSTTTLTVPDDDLAHFIDPDGGDSRFGHSFGVGDLDGDGWIDVAVGASDGHQPSSDEVNGFVSVFRGPTTGTLSASDANTTIQGPANTFAYFGGGLTAGDLNGDGTDDLVASAPVLDGDDPDTDYDGFVGIWFGPLDPGTLDLDSADVRIVGDADNTYVGDEMQAGHDLDGDGDDDLFMGAGYVEEEGTQTSARGGNSARAWLYFSPMSGGTHEAANADVIFSNGDLPGFGLQVSLAGDTNGDGNQEVLAGHIGLGSYLFEVPTGY